MKNILTFLFILILLFSLGCQKKSPVNNDNQVEQELNFDYEEENKVTTIDFDKMKSIVDNSKAIDVEVFFAISVLHRKFILSCEAEAKNLTQQEQTAFFETKRKEFFDSIKYTEKQYNAFVETNTQDLNNYINLYPEIAQFLTTTN